MSITKHVDAITHISEDYKTITPPCPKSVKIELTARCDLHCRFCATGQKLRERGDMDFRLLSNLLIRMRKAGVEEIGMFYLGESFLYPKLVDAIREAKVIGFPYVFLTTNGRMALSTKVHECISAGLDSLKFSFNWADGEQCKEVTGVDCFDRVVNNIKQASLVRDIIKEEVGHNCGIYASSIRYDDHQQEKMEKAVELIRPYIDEHYWLPLYNQAGLVKGQVAGNVGRYGNMRDSLPCWSIFTEGHITYDGKLSACCFDHDGRFNMGDLTEIDFMDAWHSEPFKELRKANLEKDVNGTACETCIAYQ